MTSDNLELPKRPRCAFCDYLNGIRPYAIAWRTKESAVLVTREQRGISHVLVVPIRHRETLLDLVGDEPQAVMETLMAAVHAIRSEENPEGIVIWQNLGIAANQDIPHMHFHVAGTLPEGGTEFGEVPEIPTHEAQRIATRLRAHAPPGALPE